MVYKKSIPRRHSLPAKLSQEYEQILIKPAITKLGNDAFQSLVRSLISNFCDQVTGIDHEALLLLETTPNVYQTLRDAIISTAFSKKTIVSKKDILLAKRIRRL